MVVADKAVETPPILRGAEADAERQLRRRRLVEAYRLFGRLGYSEGTAGHLTVRDPEEPEHFWAAPYGMHFSQVCLGDLVLTDVAGNLYHGNRPAHPAALPFHGIVHSRRPDVVAAAHAHSDYGRAMAALGRRILAITQDACAFSSDTAYLDSYAGVVLDEAQGAQIGDALGSHKAILLRSHGIFTVGGSVEEMAWWFLSLEKVCKVQLAAEAVGVPEEIPEPVRSETEALVGSPSAALVNARPMFEWIASVEPDMYTERKQTQ